MTKGADPKVEGEQVAVAAEPTLTEEKSTEKILSEAELEKVVNTRVSKGLESMTKQLSQRDTAVKAAEAEASRAKAESEVHLTKLKQREEDLQTAHAERDRLAEQRFADDPEALKGYRQTQALELREKQATLREQELNVISTQQEERSFRITKAEIATELQKEYVVPNKVLQACTSEEQMRVVAEAFPKVGEVEPDKAPEEVPKFASNIPSGDGDMPTTAHDKMRAGWREIHK